jgi:hypothetical protein
MPEVSLTWSWISLILLGSFHGINPAMGWLFAVALGLQERRTSAVVAAIGPIALGHALSIATVVVVVWLMGTVLPQEGMLLAGGAAMLGFAGYKVVTRFRHPRWVGMQVGSRDLVAWSFLMATAHGAGLMLLPPILALRSEDVSTAVAGSAHAGHHAHHIPEIDSGSGASDLIVSLMAVGLHTVALFAVTGAIALLVYEKVGVDILRRAWINIDLIWIGALGLAGAVTIFFGIWGLAFAA